VEEEMMNATEHKEKPYNNNDKRAMKWTQCRETKPGRRKGSEALWYKTKPFSKNTPARQRLQVISHEERGGGKTRGKARRRKRKMYSDSEGIRTSVG
jgi:hypothetical protein